MALKIEYPTIYETFDILLPHEAPCLSKRTKYWADRLEDLSGDLSDEVVKDAVLHFKTGITAKKAPGDRHIVRDGGVGKAAHAIERIKDEAIIASELMTRLSTSYSEETRTLDGTQMSLLNAAIFSCLESEFPAFIASYKQRYMNPDLMEVMLTCHEEEVRQQARRNLDAVDSITLNDLKKANKSNFDLCTQVVFPGGVSDAILECIGVEYFKKRKMQ